MTLLCDSELTRDSWLKIIPRVIGNFKPHELAEIFGWIDTESHATALAENGFVPQLLSELGKKPSFATDMIKQKPAWLGGVFHNIKDNLDPHSLHAILRSAHPECIAKALELEDDSRRRFIFRRIIEGWNSDLLKKSLSSFVAELSASRKKNLLIPFLGMDNRIFLSEVPENLILRLLGAYAEDHGAAQTLMTNMETLEDETKRLVRATALQSAEEESLRELLGQWLTRISEQKGTEFGQFLLSVIDRKTWYRMFEGQFGIELLSETMNSIDIRTLKVSLHCFSDLLERDDKSENLIPWLIKMLVGRIKADSLTSEALTPWLHETLVTWLDGGSPNSDALTLQLLRLLLEKIIRKLDLQGSTEESDPTSNPIDDDTYKAMGWLITEHNKDYFQLLIQDCLDDKPYFQELIRVHLEAECKLPIQELIDANKDFGEALLKYIHVTRLANRLRWQHEEIANWRRGKAERLKTSEIDPYEDQESVGAWLAQR